MRVRWHERNGLSMSMKCGERHDCTEQYNGCMCCHERNWLSMSMGWGDEKELGLVEFWKR